MATSFPFSVKTFICFIAFAVFSNNLKATGWFDTTIVMPPVTGDDSQWIVSAVGPEAAADNARLMYMAVYDYYSNCTFGTYLGGTGEEDAGIYVFGYNHTTQQQIDSRVLYVFADAPVGSRFDGHSYPQIVKSFDGHIHVFFCDQRGDGNNVHIRFNERGSITSDYSTQVLLYGSDGFLGRSAESPIVGEYPKPFVARNGAMYFMSRSAPRTEPYFNYNDESYRIAYRAQVMVKSTDNGITWQPAEKALMRFNDADYLTEPYLTQVIAEPERNGVEERFHFAWTLAAGIALWYNENGELDYNYHNAYSKNLYHAYFEPNTETFYSVDGKNLGKAILNEEMDNYCLVKQNLNNTYPLPMKLEQYQEVDQNNTSIMGNFTSIDNLGNTSFNYAYNWTGTEWEHTEVDIPGDMRLAIWRDDEFIGYDGFGIWQSNSANGPWDPKGHINFEGTSVSDRLDDLGYVKSCPAPMPSHPEAFVWVKAYPAGAYGGFVGLGGHRTSYIPSKIVVETEKGTVERGEAVRINAYIVDENYARILSADNQINLNCNVGVFSDVSTKAFQGYGTSILTINESVSSGEYIITATGEELESGYTYITVVVEDNIKPNKPDSLFANVISSSQVDLSWNMAKDNLEVLGYHIYRDGEDLVTTSDTVYNDINLDESTTYSYTVAAFDAYGNESETSNEITVTTPKEIYIHDTIHNINNYPNPFHTYTYFVFDIEEPGEVDINIYDTQGGLKEQLEYYFSDEGTKSVIYIPVSLSSGIYTYQIILNGESIINNKMVFIK